MAKIHAGSSVCSRGIRRQSFLQPAATPGFFSCSCGKTSWVRQYLLSTAVEVAVPRRCAHASQLSGSTLMALSSLATSIQWRMRISTTIRGLTGRRISPTSEVDLARISSSLLLPATPNLVFLKRMGRKAPHLTHLPELGRKNFSEKKKF